MRVNGEEKPLSQPVTVRAYLEAAGYRPDRVAVERNGEIVPRARFDSEMLQRDDVLEVVQFVGGG